MDTTYTTVCPVTGKVGTYTCTFFSTPDFITVNGVKYLWCIRPDANRDWAKDAYNLRQSALYKPKYLSWYVRFVMKQRGCSTLQELWQWVDNNTNQGVVACLIKTKGFSHQEAVALCARNNPNPTIAA